MPDRSLWEVGGAELFGTIYKSVIATESKRWPLAYVTSSLTKTKVHFYPYQFSTFQFHSLSHYVLLWSLHFVMDISRNTDYQCAVLPNVISSIFSARPCLTQEKLDVTDYQYRLLRLRTLTFQPLYRFIRNLA
jgi:hypothetical protein